MKTLFLPLVLLLAAHEPEPAPPASVYCLTTSPLALVQCPAGLPGPPGPQGIQGIQGVPGPQGIPGTGITGVPLASLPTNSLAIGPLADGTYMAVQVVNTDVPVPYAFDKYNMAPLPQGSPAPKFAYNPIDDAMAHGAPLSWVLSKYPVIVDSAYGPLLVSVPPVNPVKAHDSVIALSGRRKVLIP